MIEKLLDTIVNLYKGKKTYNVVHMLMIIVTYNIAKNFRLKYLALRIAHLKMFLESKLLRSIIDRIVSVNVACSNVF